MRFALALLAALVLVPLASGAAPAPPPALSPITPPVETPRLTEKRAVSIFVAHGKVTDWLERYPPDPTTEATYSEDYDTWRVHVSSGQAGEVAIGGVDDSTGAVLEAWTGPQVWWKMARGYEGAFGGTTINSPLVWLAFCLAFLLGLADLRRPFSVRNLDLLVLLSFSVSLWFFNRGDIFTSVPLVYPPLVYLLARMLWSSARRPGSSPRPLWPAWVLVAATVFLVGFRIELNVRSSNVSDVGYAGAIGAHRIASGEAPYGHMPVEGDLKRCAPPDADGGSSYRIQTNGRCEAANDRGDTYGPVSYQAYLPGYAVFGWDGKGDNLHAARLTSILFDLLCLIGLAFVGRRFGGPRLAATLAFAWAAYPFTQYASNSNTNDAVAPAFLIWGFLLLSSPIARGVFAALAGWTKFFALPIAPLWASYPQARPLFSRGRLEYLFAFAVATAVSFWVLLLEPAPLHAARVFWDRTLGWQIGRESPFSIWDWRQYHAEGLPDLHLLQIVLEAILVAGALVAYFLPRRKSPLQLAAMTAALVIGFELVVTHWFYFYLPWFFPFVAFVLLAPATTPVAAPSPRDRLARARFVGGCEHRP